MRDVFWAFLAKARHRRHSTSSESVLLLGCHMRCTSRCTNVPGVSDFVRSFVGLVRSRRWVTNISGSKAADHAASVPSGRPGDMHSGARYKISLEHLEVLILLHEGGLLPVRRPISSGQSIAAPERLRLLLGRRWPNGEPAAESGKMFRVFFLIRKSSCRRTSMVFGLPVPVGGTGPVHPREEGDGAVRPNTRRRAPNLEAAASSDFPTSRTLTPSVWEFRTIPLARPASFGASCSSLRPAAPQFSSSLRRRRNRRQPPAGEAVILEELG